MQNTTHIPFVYFHPVNQNWLFVVVILSVCMCSSVFINYLKRRTKCFASFYFSSVAMVRIVLGMILSLLTPFKVYDICYSKCFPIYSPYACNKFCKACSMWIFVNPLGSYSDCQRLPEFFLLQLQIDIHLCVQQAFIKTLLCYTEEDSNDKDTIESSRETSQVN